MSDWSEWVGRTETRQDTVWPHLLSGLAATLGTDPPETLPALWHWMLFQDWVTPDGLGTDGHPRRGGFLPPVHDLPRRMWAGGRIRFQGILRPGETVTRTSTIRDVAEKQGGTGRLVFVTVAHEIAGPRGPAITEEHDIVYRGAEGSAVKPAQAALPAPDDATVHVQHPDPVLLFRYSALTGNGHRIHYDFPYATQVEGYSGLIVHGPLQATWLAGLAERIGGAAPTAFSFRGQRPAFAGSPLAVQGWREGGMVRLRTLDPGGAVCMAAEASFG